MKQFLVKTKQIYLHLNNLMCKMPTLVTNQGYLDIELCVFEL